MLGPFARSSRPTLLWLTGLMSTSKRSIGCELAGEVILFVVSAASECKCGLNGNLGPDAPPVPPCRLVGDGGLARPHVGLWVVEKSPKPAGVVAADVKRYADKELATVF